MLEARSSLMKNASRLALLDRAHSALQYGRRQLSAQCIEELARRAMLQHAHIGIGISRARRLERLISGRFFQIVVFYDEAPPAESKSQYDPMLDTSRQWHAQTEAILAYESMTWAVENAQKSGS